VAGWQYRFKLEWGVDPEPDGNRRIRGYITSQYGERADSVRLLWQALDSSGAVVGQRIAYRVAAHRGGGKNRQKDLASRRRPPTGPAPDADRLGRQEKFVLTMAAIATDAMSKAPAKQAHEADGVQPSKTGKSPRRGGRLSIASFASPDCGIRASAA
jgi:hypothetical protein